MHVPIVASCTESNMSKAAHVGDNSVLIVLYGGISKWCEKLVGHVSNAYGCSVACT